ncbi:hypothetical protein K0M31_013339 [Melipona bicolor]|uniref:Uncharacterized protein n=1 Tax=Melipona bicolor TaxID=60889 RepID=A0AA40KGT4_9HYME|nr:hypothetical protein K0M31_013339 [Melipona bicolor]
MDEREVHIVIELEDSVVIVPAANDTEYDKFHGKLRTISTSNDDNFKNTIIIPKIVKLLGIVKGISCGKVKALVRDQLQSSWQKFTEFILILGKPKFAESRDELRNQG